MPLLFVLPYMVINSYERSRRVNQIVESLAQGSRDLEQMTQLIEGPVTPWTGERAEELGSNEKGDLSGFLILQDLRIIDLRNWKPTTEVVSSGSYLYGYR